MGAGGFIGTVDASAVTLGRVVLGAVGATVVGVLLLAMMVAQTLTPGASPGAAALAVSAAYGAKEGQGDLTCGAPQSGPGGPGAAVAAAAARAAGFTGRQLVVAVAVAGAESGWNPNATHVNADGSVDYGEWQINSVHADLLAAGDWRDPYSNARMARQVWADAGGSWSPWATFTSGAYSTRMSAAMVAVNGKGPIPKASACGVSSSVPGGKDHMTGATVRMRDAVSKAFPGLTIGCYRQLEDGGEHPRGRACDFMVTGRPALGSRIAAWVQARASQLGVLYVIWWQHIWSPARADEGWRPMEDRGSPTQNHEDHVHVSVKCYPGDPPWARPCLYQ